MSKVKSSNEVKVSIIIVYFSGWEFFKKCLQSIKEQKTEYQFETIIINNGKESIKQQVKAILTSAVFINNKNNGYGAGNNVGSKKAKGEYLLILNADVELQKSAMDELVAFLEKHNDTAIVAPNLLYPDKTVYKLIGSREMNPLAGAVAHSFINTLFPQNPISRYHFMLDIPSSKVRQVFAVPGCVFMIRKQVFEEVGSFDENIFLYYEESDLGKRIQDVGYKVFVIPKAEVIHHHTFASDPNLKKYNIQSRFYYFKKHYGMANALLVEMFARFSKRKAIIASVVLVVVVLLLYI